MGQFEAICPSGAKAPFILRDLMYGLKPVPFKLTHYRMAERLTLVCLALLHLLVVAPVNETAALSCRFTKGKMAAWSRRL